MSDPSSESTPGQPDASTPPQAPGAEPNPWAALSAETGDQDAEPTAEATAAPTQWAIPTLENQGGAPGQHPGAEAEPTRLSWGSPGAGAEGQQQGQAPQFGGGQPQNPYGQQPYGGQPQYGQPPQQPPYVQQPPQQQPQQPGQQPPPPQQWQ